MKHLQETQAVILAGGFGTRLSPLTDTKPKPLVKILDKTVLDAVLDKTVKAGVSKVTLSTFYMAEMIRDAVKERENVNCVAECIPLGTAGGVKKCHDGVSGNILVLSGDGVFDFDLGKIIDFHLENQNDVTIVLSKNENPTEYGCVICDSSWNVESFCEKPPWKRVKTNLVNTGIYVISKRVLDEIPDNIPYDFSKDLFVRLLRSGSFKMKGFLARGNWCDIGSLDEYCNANIRAARGEDKCFPNDGLDNRSLMSKGVFADEGVYVSPDADIGKNVRITNGSVICSEVKIERDCDICTGIVGRASRIGKGTAVGCAIVGENVTVGENCIIPEGCVVADGARIEDGTVLKRNSRIRAGERVSGEDKQSMGFSDNEWMFLDDGKAVFKRDNEQSPMSKFVKSTALVLREENGTPVSIGVMCRDGGESVKNRVIFDLFRSAETIYDMGVGSKNVCRFAGAMLPLDAVLYVGEQNGGVEICVFGKDGTELTDEHERKIKKCCATLENNTSDNGVKSSVVEMKCIGDMYVTALCDFIKSAFPGVTLSDISFSASDVKGYSDGIITDINNVISHLGIKNAPSREGTVTLGFDVQGDMVLKQNGKKADKSHLRALILKNADVLGIEGVNIPEDMPLCTLSIAGVRAKLSAHTPIEKILLFDDTVMMAALLAIVKVRNASLEELLCELPKFEVFRDEYAADSNRASTMERLSKLYSAGTGDDGSGILLRLAEGSVRIIPKRSEGFRIISEAGSMEAAKEISAKISKAIKNEK